MKKNSPACKLAVIVPSRGLSFSRTMEELLNELNGLDYELFFSIGNPLPDCFNLPLDKVLQNDSFTHILIVEDDMIIPKNILKVMINQHYPVVALDYPFKNDGDATTLFDPDGFALYTGTGFILIERWVLENIPKPVFRTDTAWDMMITKDNKLLIWGRDVSKIKTYGLHDVNFGLVLWSNGIPIKVMERTAGQRKLRKKGEGNTNNGADEIYELTHVWRNNTTKSDNPYVIKGYIERVNQITDIQILDKKPKNVYYEDGQARIRGEHVII